MSHKLHGKKVDDILTEFWGPHSGRNYFVLAGAAVPPQLRVQVFAANAGTNIIVEENTNLEFVGTNNSNAIGSTPVRGPKLVPTRTPGDWVTLGGGALDVSDGLTTITLTARADPYAIRVRVAAVTHPENGSVAVATEWN